MMDKSKKLKNYQRKDYSQLVKFPVEIIGRDGIVRRYSFEASVRLYQRRIASARLRYHDPDVAGAETGHCRSRITQLRRSYCEHYGWPAVQEEGTVGEFAGEVVAFLRRFLGEEEVDLELGNLGSEDGGHVWFVQQPDIDRRYLLYLYPFETNGPCAARESFFQLLRWVQATHGEEVERLIAFHHTADCGLVLTASGRQIEETADLADFFFLDHPGEGPFLPVGGNKDAFQRGIRALSVGDADGSMVHFEHAIAENPYRQKAHACVVAVTDYLERPQETEIATRAALHYFPKDPDLHYMQAVAHYKMRSPVLAHQALQETVRLQGETERSRALGLRIHIQQKNWLSALQGSLRPVDKPNDAVADLLRHRSIRRSLRWRRRFGSLALFCGISALSLALVLPSVSGVLLGAGLLNALFSRRFLPRKLAFDLAKSDRLLGLGLPENLLLEGVAER
jgi:hypothetical protein